MANENDNVAFTKDLQPNNSVHVSKGEGANAPANYVVEHVREGDKPDPASRPVGDLVWNDDTGTYEVNNGTAWVALGGGGGGALAAGFQDLQSEGTVIDPAVGMTIVGDVGPYTLVDGETDGQMKFIMRRTDALAFGDDAFVNVRFNLFRRLNSNYAAINTGVRMYGASWVLLRWTEDVPVSGGDRDLWVIVGSSQILQAEAALPHTLLMGHGRGVEADDAVTVQLLPIIPEGGSGITGVRMVSDGRLSNWSLRYHSTENIPDGVTLRVLVGGVPTDIVVAGSFSSGTETTFSDETAVTVGAGEVVQVLLLGEGIGAGGVLTASLAVKLEDTAGGLPPYLLISQGTVPS